MLDGSIDIPEIMSFQLEQADRPKTIKKRETQLRMKRYAEIKFEQALSAHRKTIL